MFRRRFRKSRATAKKGYKPRVWRRKAYKAKPSRVHLFKRRVLLTTITANASTNVYGGQYFGLSDVPNSSEFTSLYDQFKICKIVCEFFPKIKSVQAVSTATTATTIQVPKMSLVVDHDDASAPTAISDLLQYPKVRTIEMTKKFKQTLIPSIRMLADQNNGVNTTYLPRYKPWIDMSFPATRHYGLKWACEAYTASGTPVDGIFGYEVYATYYIACKDPR